MHNTLILAPMRGITDKAYRTAFARNFSGFDYAVAPFVAASASANMTNKFLREFDLKNPCLMPTIPQILSNNHEDFVLIANALFDAGYKTVNWNLGCPFPMVVNKNKGSGLLRYPHMIVSFLEKSIPLLKCRISIKMRLGFDAPDAIFQLLPEFNSFPIEEIVIHPRTAKQMYTGVTDLNSFEKCLELSKHEIVYNGDIISASQFQEMSERFKLKKWMIGRGALRNPFLPDEIKSGKEIPIEEKYSRLKRFHDEIFSEYSNKIENKTHILDRMKGQWFYLGSFFDNRKKELKKIKKTSSIKKYLEETEIIFSNQVK